MASVLLTYQLIADIISSKTDVELLRQKLSTTEINWDHLVKVASKHLVLPTIYCSLKKKKMTDAIPVDLSTYLEEITQINRNRNLEILKEVNGITHLFKTHGINHVLLKGCAMLVGKYYDDPAERMIGDIDILVDKEHLETANNLLLKHGYSAAEKRLSHDFYLQKHLPRLVPENGIAAVELHGRLLRKSRPNALDESEVLMNKQTIDGYLIPSPTDLFKHMVLSLIHDDRANYFGSISFKCNYDSLVLIDSNLVNHDLYKADFCKSYFLRSSELFDEFRFDSVSPYQKLRLRFNRFNLNNTKFYRFRYQFLELIRHFGIYFRRIVLFLTNGRYRSLVLRRKPLKINNIHKVV